MKTGRYFDHLDLFASVTDPEAILKALQIDSPPSLKALVERKIMQPLTKEDLMEAEYGRGSY